MPQSRTRYQRAAKRSRYRKPKRKRGGSLGWNIAIAAVVVGGIVLLTFAVLNRRNSGAGSGPPRAADQANNVAGDHWHTALNVDICGEWLDNPPEFLKPYDSPNQVAEVGIHSHGDGLIHIEPTTSADAGKNATVGRFFGNGGWGLSSDSIDLGGSNAAHAQWQGPKSDPTKTTWSNGDICPFGKYKGEKVQLTWAVDGKQRTGNPADYHLENGVALAIYLLPKGADMPFPEQACTSFQRNADQSVLSKKSPCTSIINSTTTTVPAATSTSTP